MQSVPPDPPSAFLPPCSSDYVFDHSDEFAFSELAASFNHRSLVQPFEGSTPLTLGPSDSWSAPSLDDFPLDRFTSSKAGEDVELKKAVVPIVSKVDSEDSESDEANI